MACSAFLKREKDRLVFRVTEPGSAQDCVRGLGLSKQSMAQLFEGGLAVDPSDAPLRRQAALHIDDLYHVLCPQAPLPRVEGVVVLYADDFLIAVDKPVGILVHSDGDGTCDLTSMLSASAGCRLQPLHRLDVDTSGVLLFSRIPAFQGLFDALVADKDMLSKEYLAVVHGRFPAGPASLRDNLARDRHDARRMRVDPRSGQEAVTDVLSVRDRGADGRCELRLRLRTGRRHQIRVQLASRGFPIVGDRLYGRPDGSPRLMLHARSLGFIHPLTGERILIEAPAPVGFGA